jgi:hypothetical protein
MGGTEAMHHHAERDAHYPDAVLKWKKQRIPSLFEAHQIIDQRFQLIFLDSSLEFRHA